MNTDDRDDEETPRSGDTTSPVGGLPSSQGMAGRVIAQYKLVKELGSGGQGYVYLAEEEKTGRRVALKMLHNVQALNPKSKLRFIREAETASKLKHPGLCEVYGFGEFEGIPYIAMRFVQGTPLSELIAGASEAAQTVDQSFIDFDTSFADEATEAGPGGQNQRQGRSSPSGITGEDFSDEREGVMNTVKMIEKVARALHAAHEVALVHRDIKPSNIIIDSKGNPVILDFGLARDDESDLDTLTQSGDLMGTPAYMSPEQITRSSIRVDRRSDVYSLGVTLYECLTWDRPFIAPTRQALYQSILFDDAVNPQQYNPAIPNDLRIILEMSMEKSPDRRYQTALEFAEDLARLTAYQPIHARAIGAWVKTLRWVSRNPMITALGAVIIIALATIAGVFIIKEKEARDEQEKAQIARDDARKARDLAQDETKAKAIALSEFERMADVERLREANVQAKSLWPARPSNAESIRMWLVKYKRLKEALPVHKEALKKLRAQAIPYTTEERRKDHPKRFAKLAVLQESRGALIETSKSDEQLDEASTKKLADLDKQIAALKEKVKKRRTWRFGDNDLLEWKHGILTKLTQDLERFLDAKNGTYTDVERRLQRAESIKTKTVDEFAALWDSTIAEISASKQYSGFRMKPLIGFIPLGKDPNSGLQEFLHWETHKGPVPQRNESGAIELKGDIGLMFVLMPCGNQWIGSQSDDPNGRHYDPDRRLNEKLRLITIDRPFLLSKYELTQGQWMRLPTPIENPSYYKIGWKHKRHTGVVSQLNPVESVSCANVLEVLRRVGLSLPTSEQWEYAARAGTDTRFPCGVSKIEDLGKWGNVCGMESKGLFAGHEPRTSDPFLIHGPVGQFLPNAFGLHDVIGNVHEWTRSNFGDGTRISRGGGYNSPVTALRASLCNNIGENEGNNHLGYRPACEIPD